MVLTDWIHLMDQIPDYGRITLTGGEPLLFKGFRELFKQIAVRFDCNIISNGVLLNEELVDFLLSFPSFKVLSISIDDIGNKVRGLHEKQWLHLVKMLRLFQAKKKQFNSSCILDVKTMVLDENSADLLKIHRFMVEEIGVDTHVFQFMKGSSIQHSDASHNLKDIFLQTDAPILKHFDQVVEQFGSIQKYSLKNNSKVFVHPKMFDFQELDKTPNLDLLNQKNHNSEKFQVCPYPGTSIHINSDGNVFPCLSVQMGNVKDQRLSEIVSGAGFLEFRNIIEKNRTVNACNRCGWLAPNHACGPGVKC